jgi:hypothetical protein
LDKVALAMNHPTDRRDGEQGGPAGPRPRGRGGPDPGGDLLAAALEYAGLGWRVAPVWRVHNGVCACPKGKDCPSPAKHPRTRHGGTDATIDTKRIGSWKWGTANIAVATGPESGLVVLDIDPRHDGDKTIRQLQQTLGRLPAGPMVKTGGGGWHMYFRHPGGRVPSRNGVAPGIDIKADGGYVVAPPSIHTSGGTYTWHPGPELALPELPAAWLDFLRGPCHIDHSPGPCHIDHSPGTCHIDHPDNSGPPKTSQDHSTVKGTSSAGSAASQTTPADQLLGRYEEFIGQCIRKSLPEAPGKRHDQVFKLARLLRAKPELAALPVHTYRPVVDRWYDLTVKALGQDNIVATADDNWWDFSEGWDKVKYPGEEGLMVMLLERAKRSLPKVAGEYRSPEVQLLVGLCRELQREAGDGPFFLATSTAARVLGLTDRNGKPDRKRAWRWLQGLVRDGVLQLVDRGDPDKRIAASYRYVRLLDG